MHFKANVKGDTSNQPLKHYMQVFAPIYSHRSILVKICDRRSISLLLHPVSHDLSVNIQTWENEWSSCDV